MINAIIIIVTIQKRNGVNPEVALFHRTLTRALWDWRGGMGAQRGGRLHSRSLRPRKAGLDQHAVLRVVRALAFLYTLEHLQGVCVYMHACICAPKFCFSQSSAPCSSQYVEKEKEEGCTHQSVGFDHQPSAWNLLSMLGLRVAPSIKWGRGWAPRSGDAFLTT